MLYSAAYHSLGVLHHPTFFAFLRRRSSYGSPRSWAMTCDVSRNKWNRRCLNVVKSKQNVSFVSWKLSRMSNTSDKGTTFGDGAARVGMQLRSSPKVDRNNADVIPCKVSYADDSINLNVDESTIPSDPIVQSVDINKSTSFAGVAGGSAKDQPNVNSNFRTWNCSGGWVFGDFVKSPIILKKWSMDTRLLKEELTRIPIWVKLHDVPIQVFEEDGISLIATFIGKPVMLDSYTSSMCKIRWGRVVFARCLSEVNLEADLVDVVTIGIPSLSDDDFTKETIRDESSVVATSNVDYPYAEKTNDGFQTVGKKKKRKGKSKSTNGGQFTGPSVKHNTTGNSSKKDNLSMSNSFSALNEEEEDDEEDVENVYDESANLIQNTKAGGSSSLSRLLLVDPPCGIRFKHLPLVKSLALKLTLM
ncbi:zinc knuckle CX2CX4HX4C containing protein [Tanacetum coccineum]